MITTLARVHTLGVILLADIRTKLYHNERIRVGVWRVSTLRTIFHSGESGVENLLRIRQEMTEKSTVPWLETDGLEEELRLDKHVIRHLENMLVSCIDATGLPISLLSFS